MSVDRPIQLFKKINIYKIQVTDTGSDEYGITLLQSVKCSLC